jgi:glycine hydroxymethyltransferase
MHIIAAKAIAFKEAMSDDFKAYQKQVVINARAMASVFIERGYDVVSGGTDNHVFLVSFIEQGLTGKAVNNALGDAHITVNMNSVPNDPQSPFVTSGIRVGTPAGTTRGFGESECKDITHWICDICDDLENEAVIDEVRAKVGELCSRFPVYK